MPSGNGCPGGCRRRSGRRCSSLLLGSGSLLLGRGSLLLGSGGLLLSGSLLLSARLLLGLGHLGRIRSVDCGPCHDGSAAPDA